MVSVSNAPSTGLNSALNVFLDSWIKLKKRAIVAHALEWAIVNLGPNFSAQTDFSSPTEQKTLFSVRKICLG